MYSRKYRVIPPETTQKNDFLIATGTSEILKKKKKIVKQKSHVQLKLAGFC